MYLMLNEMFFPSISKLISIDEVERIEWNDINKKDEQQKKKKWNK